MGASKRRAKDTESVVQSDPEGLMRARIAYIHDAVLQAETSANAMGVDPDSHEYDPPQEPLRISGVQSGDDTPARGRSFTRSAVQPPVSRSDFSNGTAATRRHA